VKIDNDSGLRCPHQNAWWPPSRSFKDLVHINKLNVFREFKRWGLVSFLDPCSGRNWFQQWIFRDVLNRRLWWRNILSPPVTGSNPRDIFFWSRDRWLWDSTATRRLRNPRIHCCSFVLNKDPEMIPNPSTFWIPWNDLAYDMYKS